MVFFISDGTGQRGPFETNQLLVNGLRADHLVWREGMAQWQRADSVAELQPLFGSRPAPPPPMYPQAMPIGYATPGYAVPPYNPNDSKKIAAGICALLLGGFGVHKFILGYSTSGIIMLLVTLLGGSFTCLITWGIMWVIGIVEGIIYLTKSDLEFYQTYVANRREWF